VTATTSKRSLRPNETTIIDVEMDKRRFSGQKSVGIWVTVGPLYTSTVPLRVTANTRQDLVCMPGDVEFDTVAPGQTPSATVEVDYAGPLALQVSEVVVPKGGPFKATVRERFRRPGRVGYQVKVTIKKGAARGQFRERIFLKTNHPDAGLLPVQVRGNIQAPLEAVPAALHLHTVKGGEPLTRQVLVRSPRPFHVVRIEGPDAVRLGEPPLPNQWQTVTLEIVPPRREGPLHYEVKIHTDLQDKPVVVAIDGVVAKE
jgi:hypothetical protein